MKTKINYLLFLFMFSSVGFAQNEVEALRYSQDFLGGTARFVSMGGAFCAIGGDISSLSYNPAGIAVYRKDSREFTITPSFDSHSLDASYFGSTNNDNKYNFSLNNIGIVSSHDLGDNNGFAGISLGFSYNRKNNFNANMILDGVNPHHSRITQFVNVANKDRDVDSYLQGLAWDSKLIFDDTLQSVDSKTRYYHEVTRKGIYGQTQQKTQQTKGSMGEYNFSLGFNYAHKLYVGFDLSIQSFRYEHIMTYKELDFPTDTFDNFILRENLETKGTGVNFKLGLIYRATDWVRLGISVHTPTFYSIKDEYQTSIETFLKTPIWITEDNIKKEVDNFYSETKPSEFEYELTTPMKVMGGIAFTPTISADQRIIISAECEFVDYSTAKLRSDTEEFTDKNKVITNTLQGALNIRAGVDYMLGQVSFRGGFAMYGNPYKDASLEDAKQMTFTGGFGFRQGNFYIDFAYAHSIFKETQTLYQMYDDVPANAILEHKKGQFMGTLGVRF